MGLNRGLKPKNHAVHDNFEVTQNSDGTYDIKCKHCSSYSKTLRTLNATKLRNHSVLGCEGLTQGQKRKIEASSQAINQKKRKYAALIPATSHTTFGEESLDDIRSNALAAAAAKKVTPTAQSTLTRTYGPV